MKGLGYTPCLADPDLWYKDEVIPDDGFEYYSCILCYVDDILVIHHDSLSILKRIDSYFKLKPASIGDPDIYLGAKSNKDEPCERNLVMDPQPFQICSIVSKKL